MYNRCTKAVLYKDNLEYNLNQIRKYVKKDVKLCVAVKADGYGHNAVLTAQIAQKVGAEFVAVATVEEGIELRENGIKCGILLLSLCTPQEMPALFKYQITPLVFTDEYIKLVGEAAKQACKNGVPGSKEFRVHLAVDTGMGRIGCYPQEAGDQAALIEASGLKLGGMCTHFAVSDSLEKENIEFTKEQFAAFKAAVECVKARGIEPGICSCGASAALLNDEDMQFDMVRPGIITYGYYPDEITKEYLEKTGRHFDIKPVLALETKVVAIRRFPAGKSVSYGRTWKASEETDIAVLPIGYADGLLRRFSPGLEVTINGRNYPVRGRICMDQCMVEIGKDNPDVKLWDTAVIFGPKESGALNTAEDLAKLGHTISYEVLTALSKRVLREIK
ncbi:MAG: alanine racemase [Treponema sp.]|nr:alanine racemase [Treponema sp.]